MGEIQTFSFNSSFYDFLGERLFSGGRDWVWRRHRRGWRGEYSRENPISQDDLWTHTSPSHRQSWLASVRQSFATRTGSLQDRRQQTKVVPHFAMLHVMLGILSKMCTSCWIGDITGTGIPCIFICAIFLFTCNPQVSGLIQQELLELLPKFTFPSSFTAWCSPSSFYRDLKLLICWR